MTAAKFLLALPGALLRDLWTWLTYDPAARWAQITGDDD